MRIRQALAWIRLLISGFIATPERKLSIQRWTDVSTRSATMRIALRTDASPYGFGAILFVKGVPIVWLDGDWEQVRGGPAWQFEWELHAALLAIDPWLLVVPIRFHRYPVRSHACFWQHPSHERARSEDRFTSRVCQRLHSTRARGRHVKIWLRCAQSVERRCTVASDLGQCATRCTKATAAWLLLEMACYVACRPSEAVQCKWARRLGPAKRTAALKGKLKGMVKGDQAQQPGAHSVPVNKGQEGQYIWKLRCATTASASHNSFAPSGPCPTAALRALIWQSPRLLQARRLRPRHGSQTSRERTRHSRNQEAEASGRRARGERRDC